MHRTHKRSIRMICLMLVIIMTATVISSCDSAQEQQGKVMTQEEYDAEYEKEPYINTERVVRVAGGYWPPPPGFGGNLIGAQTGDPAFYIYESDFYVVRGTDKVVARLAESYEHKGNSTFVKLRKDRYWNDGEKFTAKDIWAYYIINFQTSTMLRYLTDLKIVDKYTIEYVWKEPVVSDINKMLFLCEAWKAVTPYHLFKDVVDQAVTILERGTEYTGDPDKYPPLGIKLNADDNAEYTELYNLFKGVPIDAPVGTGPYMVDKVTNTECILKINPYFPDKDKLEFNTIRMHTVADYNSLLTTNATDSYIGTLPYDMALNILAQSKEMVMYPILETRCIGVLFNSTKEPFNNKVFRQAVNYVVDKKPVREMANYWAKESDVATVGIIPSTIEKYVDNDVISKITRYGKDSDKAAAMLESIGWTKNSKGKYEDENGKTYKFIIAANSGWGAQGIGAATEVAQQLTAFGLETEAKAVEATVVVQNMKDGRYDMMIDFIDMTWNISDPYRCFSSYYGEISEKCGISSDDLEKLVLTDHEGKDIKVKEAVNALLYLEDGEEKTDLVSRLAWATNENALGMNLYQNVMCIWENYKNQKGLPMEREIEYFNKMMPLPRNEEEYEAVAILNREYAPFAEKYLRGVLKPR